MYTIQQKRGDIILSKIPNLTTENNRAFLIDIEKLKNIKKELEYFLKDEDQIKTIDFSKTVMYSQEIMHNNNIEGYKDDVSIIEKVIEDKKTSVNNYKRNRIINLHKGYNYILNKKDINKDNLKELYTILSNGLLSDYDLSHMGEFYRNDDVFIFFSDSLEVEPDKGVNTEILTYKMDELLNYLNSNNDFDNMTDYYIKSQIAHFYFVYLHPYFDINGRSARTTSMWYLLNNEAYPYTIFNRAIRNNKSSYYSEIRYGKETRNITNFVNYLMISTKEELEKEYILNILKNCINEKLTSSEVSSILSILSMKGLKTLKDFAYIYNNKNDKKRVNEVYSDMIEPLLDKNILVKIRDTDSFYDSNKRNFIFDFNNNFLDVDPMKVKRIKLKH